MLCGANGPGRGLTDEPCFVAGAQGIARIERQAFADMMKGAQYTLHDFTLNSPQVQMLGTDIAIIAYTVHEDLTVEASRWSSTRQTPPSGFAARVVGPVPCTRNPSWVTRLGAIEPMPAESKGASPG